MAKKTNINPEDYGPSFNFPESATLFAYTNTPDEYEGKVSWYVQIAVDDSPEWEATLKRLQDFQDERSLANGKSTKPLTCLKVKDGQKFLKVQSNSQDKFVVVDAKNKPYTEDLWRGSRVVVNATPKFYTGLGSGLTLYLNGVQVIANAKDAPREDRPQGAPTVRRNPFAQPAGGDVGDDPRVPF